MCADSTVNVLKFRTLATCRKRPRQIGRPRSDCFWRSSLIRVFSICYSDKKFVNSSPEIKNFIWEQKEKSVQNFKTFTVIWLPNVSSLCFFYKTKPRRIMISEMTMYFITLDKQLFCVNTQLKSSKKQLKWNVCVPKSNSNDRYAITCMRCNCIPFGPFRFHSANKQMPVGYLFLFLLASAQLTSVLWKYRCPVQYFAEKLCDESETLQSIHDRMSTRGWDLLQVQYNPQVWYFRKADNGSELL